jgi:membrane protease YdiL (CAAX protease family)
VRSRGGRFVRARTRGGGGRALAVAARSSARLTAWLWFVGIFAALAYAGRFAGDVDPAEEPLYEWATGILGLIQFAVVAGVILLIAIRAPKRELFALRRPRSWPAALGIAILICVAMLLLSAAISPFLDPAAEQGLVPETWPPPEPAAFGLNAVVVVAIAPMVEELTFRGLGYTLLERFGQAAAIVGTAVAFTLAHGLIEAAPQIFGLALGLAILRARSNSVYPPILLHASFNGFALAFAALSAG